MAKVYVSIGSNIDKEKNIISAVKTLQERFGDLSVSNVYATQAIGFAGDDFHNLVVGLETDNAPIEISQVLKDIETSHGRIRGKEKFESRTLDLDQLLYGDLVMQMTGINIPHPDILQYDFVLKPLAEIAGDVMHPEEEVSIESLWEAFKNKGDMQLVEYRF